VRYSILLRVGYIFCIYSLKSLNPADSVNAFIAHQLDWRFGCIEGTARFCKNIGNYSININYSVKNALSNIDLPTFWSIYILTFYENI